MTPRGSLRRAPERRFRALSLASGLALAAVAGCDVPTEPPELESRWVVPVEETRFSVGELLTEGDVDFNTDSSAFVVTVDPVQIQQTLGDLCALCTPALDGQTIPKPAFVETVASGLVVPTSVASFALVGGSVEVQVDNGLNFDPIRPSAALTGSVTLEILDSADDDVLGSATLDGAVTSLPASSSVTETIVLAPASVEGDLLLRVSVDSPAGDPIVLDRSLSFAASATASDIQVSEVTVDVSDRNVQLDPVELDSEDLEAEIIDRIQEGSLVLDLVNPFGVAADFTLEIDGPTIAPLTRDFGLSSDETSSVRVSYTGAELRSFLGEPGVTFSGSAVVDPAAGFVRVTPGQDLELDASLDVTLRVGG